MHQLWTGNSQHNPREHIVLRPPPPPRPTRKSPNPREARGGGGLLWLQEPGFPGGSAGWVRLQPQSSATWAGRGPCEAGPLRGRAGSGRLRIRRATGRRGLWLPNLSSAGQGEAALPRGGSNIRASSTFQKRSAQPASQGRAEPGRSTQVRNSQIPLPHTDSTH